MERQSMSSPSTEKTGKQIRDPKQEANQTRGDRIVIAVLVLCVAAFVYATIFWLIPAGNKRQFVQDQAQAATVEGPQVLREILEEMKRMRVVLERIAPALTDKEL